MQWSSQRKFATSKLVRSSPVWLVIVPIAAKSLSTVSDFINVQIFGQIIKLTTALPFSWQLLFFAACSFTLAGIIYSIFCPHLVKDYRNFAEFERDGKSRMQINCSLKLLVEDSKRRRIVEIYTDQLTRYLKRYTSNNELNGNSNYVEIIATLDDMKKNTGKNSNAFYYVDYLANNHNQAAIRTSFMLYMLGFFLISLVAFQNVYYVASSF